MDITVRLYRLHDYDLIYLYKNLRWSVKDAMLEALKAYVRKEPVKIRCPLKVADEDEIGKIKNVQFHLKLDEEKDSDLITFLGGLKKSYRNSFLKNLLRYHLYSSPVLYYEANPNADDEMEREALRSFGEAVIDVRTMKKKQPKVLLTEHQKEAAEKIGLFQNENMEVKTID